METPMSVWMYLTKFARNAEPGEYMYKWADTATDPYSDAELAEVDRLLAKHELRLATDDVGLRVVGQPV